MAVTFSAVGLIKQKRYDSDLSDKGTADEAAPALRSSTLRIVSKPNPKNYTNNKSDVSFRTIETQKVNIVCCTCGPFKPYALHFGERWTGYIESFSPNEK